MKNLVLTNHKVFQLPSHVASTFPDISINSFGTTINPSQALTLDAARQVVYFVNSTQTLYGYSLLDQIITLEVPLYSDDPEMDELLRSDDSIVSIQYLSDSESVVIVSSNNEIGQIIQVYTSDSGASSHNTDQEHGYANNNPTDDHHDMFYTPEDIEQHDVGSVEIIGQIPGGFSHAAWSPDLELFVIACNSGSLIVMSNTFDIVGESTLVGDAISQQNVATANPYTHLSGTQQYKSHQEATKTNTLVSSHSETDAFITWRGDGQYFATSSLKPIQSSQSDDTPQQYHRILRVWNRQGVLTSVSEPMPSSRGLQGPLFIPFPTDDSNIPHHDDQGDRHPSAYHIQPGMCNLMTWRPSGNVICTILTERHQHGTSGQYKYSQKVVFYERAGLTRYSFPLNEENLPGASHPGHIILNCCWNDDSTILSIASYDCLTQQIKVRLFTTKNYHWYCKYTYVLPCMHGENPTQQSIQVLFHPGRAGRLILVSNWTTIYTMDFVPDVNNGTSPLHTTVSIDGRVINLTHLQRAAIPPPLAARSIIFDHEVNAVALCTTIPSKDLQSIHDNTLKTSHNIQRVLVCTNGLRQDLVSPLCVQTSNQDILFLTEACPAIETERTSYTYTTQAHDGSSPDAVKQAVYKETKFAPLSQPERIIGLGRSTTTALPCATAVLSFTSIQSYLEQHYSDINTTGSLYKEDADELATVFQNPSSLHFRHMQWLQCSQWRDVLLAFTVSRQEQFMNEYDDELGFTFSEFLELSQSSKDEQHEYLQMIHKITQGTNIITLVASSPYYRHDILLTVQFGLDFVYHPETKTFTPSVHIHHIDVHPLSPNTILLTSSDHHHPHPVLPSGSDGASKPLAGGVNPTTAGAAAVATSTTSNIGLLSPPVKYCATSIVRTHVVPNTIPLPKLPGPEPTEEELIEWCYHHYNSVTSPPWLALLTTDGQVIRVDIKSPSLSPSLSTNTQSKQLAHHHTHTSLPHPTNLGFVSSADSFYFKVTDMNGEHAFISYDQTTRLFINHTVVAPRCLSFDLVDFSSTSTPLPPFVKHVIPESSTNLKTTGTGHGKSDPTALSSPSTLEALSSLPQGLLPSFLMTTVAGQQHALFTVDLRRSIDENIDPMGEIRRDPHMIRIIERGGQIITTIADLLRPRLVLQMPRGNLEVVNPRSMGLSSIYVALMAKQYNHAFASMRANRIDFNLLYDHDPKAFEENVDLVVKQLHDPDNIALFLSSLTEEDCTVTQFPRYHGMFSANHEVYTKLIDMYKAYCDGIEVYLQSDHDVQGGQASFAHTPSAALYSAGFDAVQRFLHPIAGGSDVVEEHANDDQDTHILDVDGNDHPPTDEPIPDEDDMAKLANDLSYQQKQKQDKQHNNQKQQPSQLKSTAVSFSNRTRAHQKRAEELAASGRGGDQTQLNRLGEEANLELTADGTGTAYFKNLSRVEHWGTGELDIRHVYTSAEKIEGDAEIAHKNQPQSLVDQQSQLQQQQQQQEQQEQQKQQNSATDGPVGLSTVIAATKAATTAGTAIGGGSSDHPHIILNATSKINHICNLVLGALTRLDDDPYSRVYLIPILTAHLRKNPPDFSSAMKLLQSVAQSEIDEKQQQGLAPTSSFVKKTMPKPLPSTLQPRPDPIPLDDYKAASLPKITAHRGLKYVLVLSDNEELWRAALGIYDLQMASSVAENSGRDPKVYMPLLSSFNSIIEYGPLLPSTQTMLPVLKNTIHQIVNYYATRDEDKVSDEDIKSISITNDQINNTVIPFPLGRALQRATINVHLERYHLALTSYAKAFDEILAILSNPHGSHSLILRLKAALYLKVIGKLIIDYCTQHMNLWELAVHLFCSPLPSPVHVPLSQTATSSSPSTHGQQETSSTTQISPQSEYQYKILSNYGDWLATHQRFSDAALIYKHTGDIRKCVDCLTEAGDYQQVLMLTSLYSHIFTNHQRAQSHGDALDTAPLQESYQRLIEVLITKKQITHAADVALYQLNDHHKGLTILLQHNQWKAALQYASTSIHIRSPTTTTNLILPSSHQFFTETFLPRLSTQTTELIASLQKDMLRYKECVKKLRIVRRVKLIIFGAIANLPQCVRIYNKGAIETGNISGLIPKPQLVLRIPGDDILEFIITGVWRGVQTGLCADGTGAGSMANMSTASGATIASLAPSLAQSLQSLSSIVSNRSMTSSRLSNGSLMSVGSMLSLGASEIPLSADERRLERHMKKNKQKKQRKKVRSGDPREESDLVIEIAYLTIQPKRLQNLSELLEVLFMVGHHDQAFKLQSVLSEYQQMVNTEESLPMPTLPELSEWQRENVKNYFNWPQSSHEDEDEIEAKWLAKKQEEKDAAERQRISNLSKKELQAENLAREGNARKHYTLPKPADADRNKSAIESSWREHVPQYQYSPCLALLTNTNSQIHHDVSNAILTQLEHDLLHDRRMTQLRAENLVHQTK